MTAFQPPPVLRDLFPKTAATVRLTPPQAVAFIELLVSQLNGSAKLPVRAKLVKHSQFKMTVDIEITPPALEAG